MHNVDDRRESVEYHNPNPSEIEYFRAAVLRSYL